MLGNCFEVAGHLALYPEKLSYNGTPKVVHAEVTGQGNLKGIRFAHAFVEDDFMVYDFSNSKNIVMLKNSYYELAQINENDPNKIRKYSFKEARKKMLDLGHYGPWDIITTLELGGIVKALSPEENDEASLDFKDQISKIIKNRFGFDLITDSENKSFLTKIIDGYKLNFIVKTTELHNEDVEEELLDEKAVFVYLIIRQSNKDYTKSSMYENALSAKFIKQEIFIHPNEKIDFMQLYTLVETLVETGKMMIKNQDIEDLILEKGGIVSNLPQNYGAVSMNIPLILRLLELAKEDIKEDKELHYIAERLEAISKKGTLTMEDYDYIAGLKNNPKIDLALNSEEYKEHEKLLNARKNKHITIDDFHIDTFANFTKIKAKDLPNRPPDYVSQSLSRYWHTNDGVYRQSNHWGRKIASCNWLIDSKAHKGETQGFCLLKDFHRRMEGLLYDENNYGKKFKICKTTLVRNGGGKMQIEEMSGVYLKRTSNYFIFDTFKVDILTVAYVELIDDDLGGHDSLKSKYENGGKLFEQSENQEATYSDYGNIVDEYTKDVIKKAYVSIRVNREIQKTNWVSYEIESIDPKPFKELSEGVLDGVIGVSSSSYNISEWLIHRECLIVMPFNEFLRLNNAEQVKYFDAYYMTKNGLEAFFRLYNTRNKDDNAYYSVLQNLFNKISNEFKIEAYTLSNPELYYSISEIFNVYNSSKFLEYVSNQPRIKSPEAFAKIVCDYINLGVIKQDYSFYDYDKQTNIEIADIISPLTKGIVSSAKIYRDESEWILKNNKLFIPKGSQLFFVAATYENFKEENEKMISAYGLRDLYKINYIKYEDIERFREHRWKIKEEKFKKELAELRNSVDKKMYNALVDIEKEILADFEGNFLTQIEKDEFLNPQHFRDFDGNKYEKYLHIPEVANFYNEFVFKLSEMIQEAIPNVVQYKNKYYLIQIERDVTQYIQFLEDENRGKYLEFMDEYGTKFNYYDLIYKIKSAFKAINIEKYAESIKSTVGGDIYRAFPKDELMLKEGGNVVLLAPNGKPSNLTPEQWHLIRTPEFKAWFGDWENDPENASKVVDENGEPLVLARSDKNRIYDYGKDAPRFFVPQKDITAFEEFGDLKTFVFLNIRNPFIAPYGLSWFNLPVFDWMAIADIVDLYNYEFSENYTEESLLKDDYRDAITTDMLAFFLKNNRKQFDGLIIKEVEETSNFDYVTDDYIAFYPSQIKLADGTNTSFDENNSDIRFAKGGIINLAPNGRKSNLTPEQYKLVRTPEFKAWFGDWENDPENASKVVDENGEPLVMWHFSKRLNEPEDRFTIFRTDRQLGAHFGSLNQLKNLRYYTLKRAEETPNIDNRKDDFRFYEVFLNIKNPIMTKDEGIFELEHLINALNAVRPIKYFEFEYINKEEKGVSKLQKIKKELARWRDIDGVIYLNRYEASDRVNQISALDDASDEVFLRNFPDAEYSYIAFFPEQIKLADGSNTTFDSSDTDIRFGDGGKLPAISKSEIQQEINSLRSIIHYFSGEELEQIKMQIELLQDTMELHNDRHYPDISDANMLSDDKVKRISEFINRLKIKNEAVLPYLKSAINRVDGISLNNIFYLAEKISKIDGEEIHISHISEALLYDIERIENESDSFSISIEDCKKIILSDAKLFFAAGKERKNDIGITDFSYGERFEKIKKAKKQYENIDYSARQLIKIFISRVTDDIISENKMDADEYIDMLLKLTKKDDISYISETIQKISKKLE